MLRAKPLRFIFHVRTGERVPIECSVYHRCSPVFEENRILECFWFFAIPLFWTLVLKIRQRRTLYGPGSGRVSGVQGIKDSQLSTRVFVERSRIWSVRCVHGWEHCGYCAYNICLYVGGSLNHMTIRTIFRDSSQKSLAPSGSRGYFDSRYPTRGFLQNFLLFETWNICSKTLSLKHLLPLPFRGGVGGSDSAWISFPMGTMKQLIYTVGILGSRTGRRNCVLPLFITSKL